VREYFLAFPAIGATIFPCGNGEASLKYTPEVVGRLIRDTRKVLGVTQRDLALTSGTGLRFIVDLEKGKETCEIGKALRVLQTLGIKLSLTPPSVPPKEE
jgi:y4mF family transcriptional regulator